MPRHLFLRANAQRWREEASWEVDDASLLLVRTRRAGVERTQLVGAGPPAPLSRAVVRAVADDGVAEVGFGLLTRGTWDLVDPDVRSPLGLVRGPVWDWMWSDTTPPVQPGEECVRPVAGPGAVHEVAQCLARAYPDTSATPDDPDLTWWGYRGPEGTLRGVAAVSAPGDGPVHVSGLGTDPAWRGWGVGTAMMAAITRWARVERPFVHFGIWSDNDAARRIYTRLGFVVGHQVENIKPQG